MMSKVKRPDRQRLTNRERKRPRVQVTIDPRTIELIDECCKLRGLSRGQVIDKAVLAAFDLDLI